jgi:hypothetical protein
MFFKQAGKHNTEETIALALKRAKELSISNIVVASSHGNTIKELMDKIHADKTNLNVICVTHHNGCVRPGENEMDAATRNYLLQQGVKVLTTTHFLAGADRAVRNQFGGVYPAEIMAQTLRIFGQGIKVAVEISTMALDAGLIPYGEEIISIGGSATGADSAVVILPEHSPHFFGTQVREIICMPRDKKSV